MVRKRRKSVSKKVSEAYEQAMLAEGAPVALDLLGFGSDISDLLSGKKRKPAAKRSAKKKVRAKTKLKSAVKRVRAKKKKPAAKSRRKR